ncbi:hypothetical protein Q4575_07630 [Psychrosphaera sp. 1_MG-2023]|uniref:tetratricopeptide repeat protein n=1 Tax=Psychrosphaera sp. 1_MG-2023 TaxID=3062643 RepID=UPI0026E448AC|nr:hypothetical protein [Psychrosphaera sp. 1_MG-2023]MDO6719263.1 hypothetical protein [Psychrosphaera sp. 1_MG-2023]
MNHIKYAILIFSCVLMYGCATHTPIFKAKAPKNIYLDHEFGAAPALETEQEIFKITEQMERYVYLRLKPIRDIPARTKRMIQDLFDPNQLDIRYVHNADLTASEAFEQGAANCLSLTILSYVLAQEARMEAKFMDVKVQENWTYNNGVRMLNGHVNLHIKEPIIHSILLKNESTYVVDFLPMLNGPKRSSKRLYKNDIIALFYNNKGANALVNNELNKAYHYFKQATILAPTITESWGNLASLYTRKGFIAETETILQYASSIDKSNLNLQESLAYLYQSTGRQELANDLFAKIRKVRTKNPYYFAMLAKTSFDKGHYRASISHFKKALKLNNQEHQFLFGLAQNYWQLGEHKRANYYLERARSLADDYLDKEKYESKIYALQNMKMR